MARALKVLIPIAAITSLVLLAGFYVYVGKVRSIAPPDGARADAVVVLTGDEDRITTATRLIAEGRGRRLLISGVHPSSRTPGELARRIGANTEIFACCVDLGHIALNTPGNADEARIWAHRHGFRSVIIVTSSYHLPRSIVEFARAMPDVELIGYPVRTRKGRLDTWWRHASTARLLGVEYLKLVAAAGRLVIERSLPSIFPPPPSRPLLPDERGLDAASALLGSGK